MPKPTAGSARRSARPGASAQIASGFAVDPTLAAAAAPGSLAAIMDCLPDVPFWIKDRKGHFVACNGALLTLLGAARPQQVLGRTDADFFPPHLCAAFARDDAAVFSSGRAIRDRVESVRNARGGLDWRTTSKMPIYGEGQGAHANEVIAVAGVTRALARIEVASAHFAELAAALALMLRAYATPLAVTELAAAVSLSVSQFERRFRVRFGVTPLRYLNRIRIERARDLLVGTSLPIAEVALRAGFCDQAHLGRHFTQQLGDTPARYRRRFR